MFSSVTTGHTTREIRPTRTVGYGDDRRTIRVQPARTNSRRTAITDSLNAR